MLNDLFEKKSKIRKIFEKENIDYRPGLIGDELVLIKSKSSSPIDSKIMVKIKKILGKNEIKIVEEYVFSKK